MSAIAGILNFHGAEVNPELIVKLTAAMKCRGPDSQTHWAHGSIALGHCMLHTTDESLGEIQPHHSHDSNLVLVWDGRLDNRAELKRALASEGAVLRDDTDAELALQSYATWGENCPGRLLGDFVFAVWDARRKLVFLAVDHMGARPFYYVLNKHFFAFASEEEALLELPGVARLPKESMVLHMLVPAFESTDNQRFWLKDVWGLQPGQRMTIAVDATARTETYFRLEAGEEHFYSSNRECEEAFLDVFGEAVRCRMRAKGDIAAMMSGGMDSASIAAMARRVLPSMPGKRFHTYSAISDDPASCIESRCIQSLTKGQGEDAHFVSVPSFTGMVDVNDLMDAAWARPHPCDNAIMLPALMCLAASRQGQRVMLHGASGDLVMAGPARHPAYLMRQGHWRAAWDECTHLVRNNTRLRGGSPALLLLLNAWTAWMPGNVKSLTHRLRRGNPLALSAASAEFAERLGLTARLRTQEAAAGRPLRANIQLEHLELINSTWGPVLGLSGYERVAGRYGVELRDPWADKRVAEFFIGLPLRLKIHEGWTKYVPRAALGAELDDAVRWRCGKEHLGWQFTVRVMEESERRMGQMLEQAIEGAREFIDVNGLRARFERYKRVRKVADQEFFFRTLSLLLWIRRIA